MGHSELPSDLLSELYTEVQFQQVKDALEPYWIEWQSSVLSFFANCAEGEGIEASHVSEWQRPLIQYYAGLFSVNQHTNLTRIDDAKGFLWRHVLDSMTLIPWVSQNATLLDLGTGAGFPAIPLALMRPDVRVTAVDSVQKKCRFIEDVATVMGLNNVTVLHTRSEELGHDVEYREQFDYVTARAVAALPTLIELGVPFLKESGLLLAMKQQSAVEEELPQSGKALDVLNATVLGVEPACFQASPAELLNHSIVRIGRTGELTSMYPRLKNKPRKSPL